MRACKREQLLAARRGNRVSKMPNSPRESAFVSLNRAQVDAAWTTRKQPYVDACVELIADIVLGGRQVPGDMRAFVPRAIDAILVLGVVPVEVVRRPGSCTAEPRVPLPRTYEVSTRPKNGCQIFEARAHDDDSREILVFCAASAKAPTALGELCSEMHQICERTKNADAFHYPQSMWGGGVDIPQTDMDDIRYGCSVARDVLDVPDPYYARDNPREPDYILHYMLRRWVATFSDLLPRIRARLCGSRKHANN